VLRVDDQRLRTVGHGEAPGLHERRPAFGSKRKISIAFASGSVTQTSPVGSTQRT
jgi:hypothetical protein